MRRTNLPEFPSPRRVLPVSLPTPHRANSTLTTAAPDTHYPDLLLSHLSSALTQIMTILTQTAITISPLLRIYPTFLQAQALQDTSPLQATQLQHRVSTTKLRINLSQATPLQALPINLFLPILQALLSNQALPITTPSLLRINPARLQVMMMMTPTPLISTLSTFNAPKT